MRMIPRVLFGTRYLVLVPILGLALAAGVFFVFGGFGLIKFLVEAIIGVFMGSGAEAHGEDIPIAIEIVEFVHLFLIGTVLYITAVGLYQLFIEEVEFHGWLKIDSTEELETNLIGVTVVVLPVSFLSIVFTRDPAVLVDYGAGIALPIAALALFIGMRAWSERLGRSTAELAEQQTPGEAVSAPGATED
jgi:uncharacterized membrane protein YqhA